MPNSTMMYCDLGTGPDTKDQGVDVFASGWGQLYEKEDSGGADCNTGPGGPEEYKSCRDWFIWKGELEG